MDAMNTGINKADLAFGSRGLPSSDSFRGKFLLMGDLSEVCTVVYQAGPFMFTLSYDPKSNLEMAVL